MAVVLWLWILGPCVWVGQDARKLGVRRGMLPGSSFDMGATAWTVCCLFLWFVAFPGYLIVRPRYVAANAPQDPLGERHQQPSRRDAHPSSTQARAPHPDFLSRLTQLGQLRDSGVLTEREFAGLKAEILGGSDNRTGPAVPEQTRLTAGRGWSLGGFIADADF